MKGLDGENKQQQQQQQMSTSGPDSVMALSGDEYTISEFKMTDFNVPSSNSSPQLLSRTDYQMLGPMKPYIKEEPTEMASCSQMSPLSPTSSGLGSSLHSQSPQNNMANYFASLNVGAQPATTSNVMYINNNADPILTAASLNIKNEAFSPQSMDICN